MRIRMRAYWGLSESERCYIYARLQRLNYETPDYRNKINALIDEIGDNYSDALHAYLTTQRTRVSVSMEFCVAESEISRKTRAFFREYKRRKYEGM